jgi:raffinose/stachyose/melibiose transport system permease protein
MVTRPMRSTDRAVALEGRRPRRPSTPTAIYLFVLPAVALLVLFNYYPMASAFYHSLFNWDGVNTTFVGLKNFEDMLTDRALIASVPNILILTAAGLVFALTLPLLAAEVIWHVRSSTARYLYRILFTIPMLIPWVVTVMMWRFLYDPIDGPINQALMAVGLGHLARPWLADADTAIYAIALLGGGGTYVGFPFIAGLNLLIYLAGLDNIPDEVRDAAKLDGCSGWQRFTHIDLPLLKGQFRLIVVFTIITQIQGFQTIIMLTRGGPGYATMVPGMAMYQNAFQFGRMGYASAIGVVLFFVMMLVTLVILNRLRSDLEYDAA